MPARLLSLLLTMLTLGQGAVTAYVDDMSLGGYLFLVNREYAISSDYVPDDLTEPKVLGGGEATRMRRDAALALEEMFEAAKKDGMQLAAVSGFRSYGQQAAIHERKIQLKGKKQALRVSAPPGCSEHQLGLAMDLGCKGNTSLTEAFGRLPEGQWVAENAHRFGFIIRYKAEWEDVTGYAYEPWHIRFVGKEHAKVIYDLDIPFETYIAQLRDAVWTVGPEGEEIQ
jgi:D-alanyl-D-alanine carboxypeptidase